MARNSLCLKHYPLDLLEVGQAVLFGPYLDGKTVSAKISREKAAQPDTVGKMDFTQHQMFLVDPMTCETVKMFLVKRTS